MKKLCLLLIIYLIQDKAFPAAINCPETFLEVDRVVKSEANAQTALAKHADDLELKISNAAESCQGNKICFENAIQESIKTNIPSNRNFLKKLFGRSCLMSGFGSAALAARARSNMFQTMAIASTAIYTSYLARKKTSGVDRFPWGMLVQGQIFMMIFSELSCRTRTVKDHAALTRLERFKLDYGAFLKMLIPYEATYVGAIMLEDYYRGEDVSSPEKLKGYLLEGATSLVWDMGWGALNAIRLNQFFIDDLPQMRKVINEGLAKGILSPVIKWSEGKKVLMYTFSQAPGMSVEVGIRWLTSVLRSYAWLQVSNAVRPVKNKSD